MSKFNARFNDDWVFPIHSSDNMLIVFNRNKGLMIDETGDGAFFPFDPTAWGECDDSAYYSALAEVLMYVITVAASVAIYNVDNVKRSMRVEDVIAAYERAILEAVE